MRPAGHAGIFSQLKHEGIYVDIRNILEGGMIDRCVPYASHNPGGQVRNMTSN